MAQPFYSPRGGFSYDEWSALASPDPQKHKFKIISPIAMNNSAGSMCSMNCVKVGRQWPANYEFNVAGISAEHRLNVVGECNLSHKKVGLTAYRSLCEKIEANRLPVPAQCRHLLFSRSGFTN